MPPVAGRRRWFTIDARTVFLKWALGSSLLFISAPRLKTAMRAGWPARRRPSRLNETEEVLVAGTVEVVADFAQRGIPTRKNAGLASPLTEAGQLGIKTARKAHGGIANGRGIARPPETDTRNPA